jgi:hypothetical protein
LADGSVEINLGKFKGCKGLFVKSLRVQGLLVERDKREGVLRVKRNRGRGLWAKLSSSRETEEGQNRGSWEVGENREKDEGDPFPSSPWAETTRGRGSTGGGYGSSDYKWRRGGARERKVAWEVCGGMESDVGPFIAAKWRCRPGLRKRGTCGQ